MFFFCIFLLICKVNRITPFTENLIKSCNVKVMIFRA